MFVRSLNRVAQEYDPSAHAEVRAIRLATKRLKKLSLEGYTLFVKWIDCFEFRHEFGALVRHRVGNSSRAGRICLLNAALTV